MDVLIRKYEDKDLKDMVEIWNEVVEDGAAFPQINPLSNVEEGKEFFASQSFTAVAEVQGKVLGLYILHPNNVGRCGHIPITRGETAQAVTALLDAAGLL